ncbi:MAG: hypothetical protein JW889_07370 [Verrucomicrobia bacterium]|nr:hypothetical protein [Verrucomicrobiota bacterium]
MRQFLLVVAAGIFLVTAAVMHGVLARQRPVAERPGSKILIRDWNATVGTERGSIESGSRPGFVYELVDAEGAIIILPLDERGTIYVLPKAHLISFNAQPADGKRH